MWIIKMWILEIGLASLQYIPSEPARIMINEPLSVEVIKEQRI